MTNRPGLRGHDRKVHHHASPHHHRSSVPAPAARRLGDRPERDERGSVTIETVAWAAAIIGIVAIAVAAITAYVRSQVGKL